FFVAWLPRIAVNNSYLTTDEGNWMGRTGLFAKGMQTNDPLLTRQSGHPGVTTMWTALVGLGLDKALYLADYVRPDGLEKAPGYLSVLLWPSLRDDFIGTLQYIVTYTEEVGGGDHENFFLGQPTSDPGPPYYLAAFALRIAPATLLGLALLAVGLLPIGPRRA